MNHIKLLSNFSDDQLVDISVSSHSKYPALYSGEIEIQGDVCAKLVQKKVEMIFQKSRERWSGLENMSFYFGIDSVNRLIRYTIGVSSENLTFSEYVLDYIKKILPNLEGLEDVKLQSDDDSDEIEEPTIDSKHRKPEEFVQIHADSKTVKNWIDSFIKSRREIVNAQNIKEFCLPPSNRQNCARVDAVLVKRKDTSSHIRVEHVSNLWGPQIRDEFSPLKNKPAADEHNYSVSKRSFQSTALPESSVEPSKKKKIYSSQDVASKLEEFKMKYLPGSSYTQK